MNIRTGPAYKILEIIEDVSAMDCFVQEDGSIVLSGSNNTCADKQVSGENMIQKATCSMSSPGASVSNLSQQESQCTSTSLYDIRSWIQDLDKENKSKSSLEKILDSGIVKDVDRQALVRNVMSHLQVECGDAYPSKEMKNKAAKSIITCFPKLKSTSGCGYEHFYNEKLSSGFLEWRLKTVRKSLKDSDKKRSRAKKRPLQESTNVQLALRPEDYESKVSELQFKMPNDTNKLSILELMDETRSNRQRWIKDPANQVTLNDILKKFPKFTDFKGELILREFQYHITDKDTFLGKFPSYYAPRILKYCKVTKPQLLDQVRDIPDTNMKALLVLPNILPSPNYMRRKTNDPKKIKGQKKVKLASEFSSKTIPNTNLLRFAQANDDIMQAVTNTRNRDPVQPFLICVKNTGERNEQFYIKADNYKIAVGSNIIVAFDILVKIHYVFDLEFAPDLEIFYNFIVSKVMSLDTTARSCCDAFDTTLIHLNEQTLDDDDQNGSDEVDEDEDT